MHGEVSPLKMVLTGQPVYHTESRLQKLFLFRYLHLNLKSPSPVAEVDGQNHRDVLHKCFSEVGFSDDSRGNFYESYMKKREERLKEQWGSNKVEKEARMKAMHDSLERSSAEMKAKLSWSADRQDSVSSAHRLAERLRSFDARSAMKREQSLDFGQLEDDEDLSEFSELKLISNGVYRNVQGKKPLLPIKNSSTSTPRTPAPRSGSTKVASGSGRQKPAAAARFQLSSYTRSRSTSEEMSSVKEEKPGSSQSLRKNSPTPSGSSDGVILTSLKFESEGVYMEPKSSFVRKNNDIGGSGIAKMKASMKNEKQYEPTDVEDDDDGQEFDTMKIQDQDDMESRVMNSKSGHGDIPATVQDSLVQDSPGESPMSWSSAIHHPFAYTQDNVESWNLNSTKATARMRKKWGSTPKHILVANAQSRTKGCKQLLKFARKSNNMGDWTATTSEGDDDTEDGRDLRKSRIEGSSFNESDFFSDQIQSSIVHPANLRLREDHLSGSSIKAPPRSFFSLPSFRSKGSESKLR